MGGNIGSRIEGRERRGGLLSYIVKRGRNFREDAVEKALKWIKEKRRALLSFTKDQENKKYSSAFTRKKVRTAAGGLGGEGEKKRGVILT